MSAPPLHSLTGLVAVAFATCALAACGGDEGAGGTSSATGGAATSNDQDAARLKLQACLRENGVDVPDGGRPAGGGGAGAADREKRQEALNGPCKELRDGAFGEVSEADRQEFQDAFAKFSQCMRDQGIDVPDAGAGGGPPAGPGRFDQDDPKVQAASEKCQDLLPQGGRGRGAR